MRYCTALPWSKPVADCPSPPVWRADGLHQSEPGEDTHSLQQVYKKKNTIHYSITVRRQPCTHVQTMQEGKHLPWIIQIISSYVHHYLDNQISYFNSTLTVNSLTENILLPITGKCRIPAPIIGLPLLITITLY